MSLSILMIPVLLGMVVSDQVDQIIGNDDEARNEDDPKTEEKKGYIQQTTLRQMDIFQPEKAFSPSRTKWIITFTHRQDSTIPFNHSRTTITNDTLPSSRMLSDVLVVSSTTSQSTETKFDLLIIVIIISIFFAFIIIFVMVIILVLRNGGYFSSRSTSRNSSTRQMKRKTKRTMRKSKFKKSNGNRHITSISTRKRHPTQSSRSLFRPLAGKSNSRWSTVSSSSSPSSSTAKSTTAKSSTLSTVTSSTGPLPSAGTVTSLDYSSGGLNKSAIKHQPEMLKMVATAIIPVDYVKDNPKLISKLPKAPGAGETRLPSSSEEKTIESAEQNTVSSMESQESITEEQHHNE